MSYPDPNNPYGRPPPPGPPPQQQPGYGYQQQPVMAPPGYPGGMPGSPVTMPGLVVTARVLLFIAGSLWSIGAVVMLIAGLTAQSIGADIPGANGAGDLAAGVAVLFFFLLAGLSALHIIPAAMFGRGRTGTRVTAIIAGSVNAFIAAIALFGQGNEAVAVLWAATAVLTIVFCSLRPAGEWFNRPTH